MRRFCITAKQWLAKVDIDPFWRLQKMRGRVIGLFWVTCIYLAGHSLQIWANGEASLSTKLSVLFGLAVWLVATLLLARLPPTRYRAFESIEVVAFFMTMSSIACGLSGEETEIVRHRGQMIVFFISLCPPVCLCMRVKVFVPYALSVSVVQSIILVWSEQHQHGIDMPATTVVTQAILSILFVTLAIFQGMIMSTFQLAESGLRQEKKTSQSLVSMLCDAWCIVDTDKDTIVETDGRFDAIMGRGMVGQRISQSVADGDENVDELKRFQDVLEQLASSDDAQASKEAVAPMTLRGYGGGCVRVTLFIVAHKSSVPAATIDGIGTSFLVGLCQSLEEERLEASIDKLPDGPSRCQPTASIPEEDTSDCGGRQSVGPSVASTELFALGSDVDVAHVLEQIRNFGRREHWLIEAEDLYYSTKQFLGSGSFGTVVCGTYFGAAVVVKVVNEGANRSNVKAIGSLCHELRILRHCRHPNLVQLKGAVCDKERLQIGLVLERASGGDLCAWMGRKPPPSQENRYRIMLGACRGLWYLHSHNPVIVHGDLKSQNVLVVSDGDHITAKLADFGLSCLETLGNKPKMQNSGTLRWKAPELFRCQMGLHPGSDMFSFGRLVQLLITGIYPLTGMTSSFIRAQLAANIVAKENWLAPATPLQNHCRHISESCVSADWSQRPSAKDVHSMLICVPLDDFDDGPDMAMRDSLEIEGFVQWPAAFSTVLDSCSDPSVFGVHGEGESSHFSGSAKPQLLVPAACLHCSDGKCLVAL